jgi:iron complex transport system substrate-binding protein
MTNGWDHVLTIIRPSGSALALAAFAGAWLALGVAAAAAQGTKPLSKPARIVSLNVCVDQILLDLVPRERIAAVTFLASDPLTVAYPERASGIPSTKGAAEDVLAHDPDLILAGAYSTPATVSLLRRVGRRVDVVSQPQTIDGVAALIRTVAAAVGEEARGDTLIATLSSRLDRVRAAVAGQRGIRPTAIVYQVNNYVSASGSLIDEAIAIAGFQNGAARFAFARNGQVSLEALLTAPPDLLILASGPTTYRTTLADNLRHPALSALATRVPTHVVPWPLWLCGTHHIADAVERLATYHK